MTVAFENVGQERCFPRPKGAELRVSVVGMTDAETHYAVSVREWIVQSTAERLGIVGKAGKGRPRSTYTGPTRAGFLLAPWEALSVAEALADAATEALAAEEREHGGVLSEEEATA